MENTLENKMKFFAQYWGQEVGVFDNESYKIENYIFQDIDIKDDYLRLKPLSSITDEDSIKVALFNGWNYTNNERLIRAGKEYINAFLDKSNMSTKVSDYLRSNGYALPYMGLTVGKMIEYGWLKLVK